MTRITEALATTGLLALILFRMAALFGNWLPHRATRPIRRRSRAPANWKLLSVANERAATTPTNRMP
jgi:hypothetical protein